jgi:hypothetical protein
MQAASVKELKQELQHLAAPDLVQLCLRLAKFKKENKELLTYLLFEAQDEEGYIRMVKSTVENQFAEINRSNYYLIKKGVRKILRGLKRYIRYSQNKATEVELLLHFCHQLRIFEPSMTRSRVLRNIFSTQIGMIERKIDKLHEDLQYDFQIELENLRN